MIKKVIKYFFILILFVLIGGFAGVFSERIVLPWLSTYDFFARYDVFKKLNEKTTVINKTEQIIVKEDFSVTKTAENILPTVVSIITYDKQAVDGQQQLSIKSGQDISQRIKTGFVLTSDGLIVSVADQYTKTEEEKLLSSAKSSDLAYKILMSDGREFDAELKAVDNYSRLAFYKVKESNLPVANFGNSDDLIVGEKIIVCGNASGNYQNTFSLGIINEKDKFFTLLNSPLSKTENLEGAILADAKIDESNIGGPVVDFNGTVVGISNQIEKDSEQIGFVMPINSVKNIFEKVMQEGKIERPYFGAYYLSINKEIALVNNLPVSKGALIYSFTGQQGLAVMKNSPAEKAGLKIGDVVIEVDGKEINENYPLSKAISEKEKGAQVELKILRKEQESILKTELE